MEIDETNYKYAVEACKAARRRLTMNDLRAWLLDGTAPAAPAAPPEVREHAEDAWHEVLPRASDIVWSLRTEWGSRGGRTVWRATASCRGIAHTAHADSIEDAIVLAAKPIVCGEQESLDGCHRLANAD